MYLSSSHASRDVLQQAIAFPTKDLALSRRFVSIMAGFWMFLVVLISKTVDLSLAQYAPVVTTTIGPVIGEEKKTSSGKSYNSYDGIRYGISKRFQDPQIPPFAPHITVAIHDPLPCPQWDHEREIVRGTEDCLYLSIASPIVVDNSTKAPVLFVIPGWHFTGYPPVIPDQFVDQGIIVVSVNYRVGILGFLSVNDSAAAGNYGLLDVKMALKWITKNIHLFNGDPNRITLLGHDAGAAIVSYLLLDNEIRDLNVVVGAITMGGNALCNWALQANPLTHANLVAEALKCDTSTSAALVSCVNSSSLDDLVLVEKSINQNYASFPLIMAPSIDLGLRDNPAVSGLPEELLKSGNTTRVPLVSGVVSSEGAHLFAEIYVRHGEQIMSTPHYAENEFLPGLLKALGRIKTNLEDVSALVKYFYYKKGFGEESTFANQTISLVSDLVYNRCVDKWNELYHEINHVDVFSYVFNYRGKLSTLDFIINELKKINETEKIVEILEKEISHGDELIYILDNFSLKDSDQKMQEKMTEMWSTFVKTQKMPDQWRPITDTEKNYLEITNTDLILKTNYLDQNTKFLNYLYSLNDRQRLPQPEEHVEDRATSTDSNATYPAVVWTLSVVSVALFIGMCVAIYLFIRQKKKTTYITRAPAYRQS